MGVNDRTDNSVRMPSAQIPDVQVTNGHTAFRLRAGMLGLGAIAGAGDIGMTAAVGVMSTMDTASSPATGVKALRARLAIACPAATAAQVELVCDVSRKGRGKFHWLKLTIASAMTSAPPVSLLVMSACGHEIPLGAGIFLSAFGSAVLAMFGFGFLMDNSHLIKSRWDMRLKAMVKHWRSHGVVVPETLQVLALWTSNSSDGDLVQRAWQSLPAEDTLRMVMLMDSLASSRSPSIKVCGEAAELVERVMELLPEEARLGAVHEVRLA